MEKRLGYVSPARRILSPFIAAILLFAVFVILEFLVLFLCHLALPAGRDLLGKSNLFFNTDCDDSVLLDYRALSWTRHLGIELIPMIGVLNKSGETWNEGDHVWMIVRLGPFSVPLDQGIPRFGDDRYYDGYVIDEEQLLGFVQQDKSQNQK